MLWSKAIGAAGTVRVVEVPFVGSQTSTIEGTTGNLVAGMTSLEGGLGSSPVAGDLILVLLTAADTAPNFGSGIILTSGYTTLIDRFRSDGYRDVFLTVGYRISDGSETSVTCSRFNNGSRGQIAHIRVYRGVDTVIPLPPEYELLATNQSIIDPPAVIENNNSQFCVFGGASHFDALSGDGYIPYASPDLENFVSSPANAIVGCASAWGDSATLLDPEAFSQVTPNGQPQVSASLLINLIS